MKFKKKEQKACIKSLTDILNSKDIVLNKEKREAIIAAREFVYRSNNTKEIVEVLLKLGLILTGILDYKDLL